MAFGAMRRMRANAIRMACLAALLAAPGAWAQPPAANYPSRAIRVIVPFPPAGRPTRCRASSVGMQEAA